VARSFFYRSKNHKKTTLSLPPDSTSIKLKDGELVSDNTQLILWQGVVKIDDSIDDYVSNIEQTGNFKHYQMKDVKYHNVNYATPDNKRLGLTYWTDTVNLLVDGNGFDQYMHAAAFIRYRITVKEKGLFKKEIITERHSDLKGFLLRRITIQSGKDSLDTLPILASYRANIGGDNSFNIQNEGHVALYASSSSAAHYNNPARISLTCVFIASNEKMFVAQQRIKSRMTLVECNSAGFNSKGQDKGSEKGKEKKPSNKKDPLGILKTRLAKGEITVQQFEELKKVIEQD
jgi:hypothetical protein